MAAVPKNIPNIKTLQINGLISGKEENCPLADSRRSFFDIHFTYSAISGAMRIMQFCAQIYHYGNS